MKNSGMSQSSNKGLKRSTSALNNSNKKSQSVNSSAKKDLVKSISQKFAGKPDSKKTISEARNVLKSDMSVSSKQKSTGRIVERAPSHKSGASSNGVRRMREHLNL
jgi:hypothetical protein